MKIRITKLQKQYNIAKKYLRVIGIEFPIKEVI